MQKKIPLVIAIIIGLVIMGVSYVKLQEEVNNATKTTQILVAKSDIEAYSIVSADNLKTISVPPNIVDENTAIKPEQIANRVTSVPLYSGKPIDIRTILGQKENFQSKQAVGIFIDAARCAGVTEGDIVDVYQLSNAYQGEAAPRIATNCRVIRVTDEKGVPVRGATAVLQSVNAEVGTVKTPRIVYLLIDPAEVPYVIQGSQTKALLSLAKKTEETKEPVVQPVEKSQITANHN